MRYEPGSVWPPGKKAAAWFSFDLDGEAWLLGADQGNARLPATMSQAAYGPRVGVFEILEELRRQAVLATFFVPSWIAQRYPAALDAIADGGHEVGLHGHVHEPPQRLSREQELEIVGRSIDVLQRVTGRRPRGYRAPGAEVSTETVAILEQLEVRYSSQFMDDYLPYFHGDNDEGLLELPFHWSCDDWPYSMFSPYALPVAHVHAISTNRHIVEVWSAEFDARRDLGGLFVLCNHPQVTGRPGRLATLRALLERATTADDVWIATGEAIDSHWRQAHPTVSYVRPHEPERRRLRPSESPSTGE